MKTAKRPGLLQKINRHKFFRQFMAGIIIGGALLLGIETCLRNNAYLTGILRYVDYFILICFAVEVCVRLGDIKKRHKAEVAWLAFDCFLLILSLVGLFEHYFTQPQVLVAIRLFRIFRIMRLFELSRPIKTLERKIFSALPAVLLFAGLLCLLLYVYSIIGMHLYDYRTFPTVNFSNLYTSFTSLFILLTNGWAGGLYELKQNSPTLHPLVSDIYVFSFFITGGMITFNIFMAVLTSHIQDKIDAGIKRQNALLSRIEKAENSILHKLGQLEKKPLAKNIAKRRKEGLENIRHLKSYQYKKA